jgi:SAM-dependent methyltransferase
MPDPAVGASRGAANPSIVACEAPVRSPAFAAERLTGLRCLTCSGRTDRRGDRIVCSVCGSRFGVTAAGVVETETADADFVHALDREIEALVFILDELDAPASTEEAIVAYAEARGVDVGNPLWEGRGDMARMMDGADGVVADIGAGLGTTAIALARSAAHVFALDKSQRRAALVAARARAEGLTNITPVHADASLLPLGPATCDLAILIGALEWTGLGQARPLESQKAVLAEVTRVLKPGGTLLLGIENRFAAHYFAGAREEHTKLRFASLLPRPVARAYCRLSRGWDLPAYTHSRRRLLELVSSAGLEPRLGAALPSYSEPQLSFDEDDFDAAWHFYLRHVYHYSSALRRLSGAVARLTPSTFVTPVVPSFWLVARKEGKPARLPTLVTGRRDRAGDIKVLDWHTGRMRRFSRTTGGLQDDVALLDGWNARRLVSSPLLWRNRLRRETALLREAADLIAARPRLPATDAIRDGCLRSARAAIARIDCELSETTRAWCIDQLSLLSRVDVDMVREHSDFVAVNLVAEAPTMALREVDKSTRASFALPGADAFMLAADVLCIGRGHKQQDLDVALSELLNARPSLATDLGGLLWADFGASVSSPLAVALTVAAVLRYSTDHGSVPGTVSFLERSAAGDLARALRRLEPLRG